MIGLIAKPTAFLNRNTGFLVLLATICFGIAILNLQQNIQNAVDDLKGDNSQQTVILCRIILVGKVEISGSDATKVEKICKDKIKQATQTGIVSNAPAPAATDAATSSVSSNKAVAKPQVSPQTSSVAAGVSSPQSAPTTSAPQPNTPQPDNSGIITPSIPIPLTDLHIPSIHIGSPF